MNLTKEEWAKVSGWLNAYRVCLSKEEKNANHPKLEQFYKNLSNEVRLFIDPKDELKSHE